MRLVLRKFEAVIAAALLLASLGAPSPAQDPPPAQQQPAPPPSPPAQPQYRVHVTSELVLVNVVARDKKGNLIRDLKKEDFSVAEDGKRQDISTFDFENVDALATAGVAQATISRNAGSSNLIKNTSQPAMNARDRRLMLLFFDFSGMDPEQIERGVDSAKKFVETRMLPADMIALVS